MPKVALVETKPSKTDYVKHFGEEFSFDQYQLCSDPAIKKVLKRAQKKAQVTAAVATKATGTPPPGT